MILPLLLLAMSDPAPAVPDVPPVPAVSFNDGNNNNGNCLPVFFTPIDTKHVVAAKLRELADMVDATGCANAIFVEEDGDD